MKSLQERWAALWQWIQGSPARVVRSMPIPPEHVHNSGDAVERFNPGEHYFAVYINELFLARARQWTAAFDPMAVVVSEFTYDRRPVTVPFVVGPSLLTGKVENVPQGMVFTETQVAGVHPYIGGKFALTVILAQVKRESYPQKLLSFIEQAAVSFPTGIALESHLKVAGAVFDGVEALFNLGDSRPLVGHRWEFNPGFTPWMKPGFFALVDADEPSVDWDRLHIDEGRLRTGPEPDAGPYRAADYLLYSLLTVPARSDVEELVFYALFKKALKEAGSAEPGSWERAKAGLVTLYQEMITSPDLTWDHAQSLAENFKKRLVAARERVQGFATLGSEAEDRALTRRMAEEFGDDPHARERAQKLLEIQKWLDL